jgi:GNAT superfamily N-acetyltransferase
MNAAPAIDEIRIPATDADPGMAEVRQFVAIRNAIEDAWIGGGVFDITPAEFLPGLLATSERRQRLFAGRIDGEFVGQAMLQWPVGVSTTVGWIFGGVLPAWRNRGLGTMLLDRAETAAREEGLSIFQSVATHPERPGDTRLTPTTGSGSVPENDPGVRFLTRHGYSLEQVQRESFLDLPVDPARLAAWRAEAEAVAGPGYRAHTWVSPTPERWLDDLATLHARLATDIPSGELEIVDQAWDADRIRRQERRAHQGGRRHVVAAVEHVPSGRLVAFNGVSLPDDRARPIRQGPTLVIKEHRGHRLGMLVKVANLQHLAAVGPESRLVMTVNAEENRHMLSINESVGFRIVRYHGIWKKAT